MPNHHPSHSFTHTNPSCGRGQVGAAAPWVLPPAAAQAPAAPSSSPVALDLGAVLLDVPELAAGVALLLVGMVAVASQVAGLAAVVAALLPLPLGLLAVLGDVAASAAVIAGFGSRERSGRLWHLTGAARLRAAPRGTLLHTPLTHHPPEGRSPWPGGQTRHSGSRCLGETRRQTGSLFGTETKRAWPISPVLTPTNTEALQNFLFDKNTSIRGKTTSATASHPTTAASTSGALPGPVARPSALEALIAAHGCSQIFKTLKTTT